MHWKVVISENVTPFFSVCSFPFLLRQHFNKGNKSALTQPVGVSLTMPKKNRWFWLDISNFNICLRRYAPFGLLFHPMINKITGNFETTPNSFTFSRYSNGKIEITETKQWNVVWRRSKVSKNRGKHRRREVWGRLVGLYLNSFHSIPNRNDSAALIDFLLIPHESTHTHHRSGHRNQKSWKITVHEF